MPRRPRSRRRPRRGRPRRARARRARRASAKTSSNVSRTSRARSDLAAGAATRSSTTSASPCPRRPRPGTGAGPVLRRCADALLAGERRPGRTAPSVSTSIDVAAGRLAPQLVGRASAISRPSAMSATASHSSASLTYWVVTSSVRPVVAQAMELVPDVWRQDRVDAGGRLVEEQQRRLVDEGARELEPALHAAGQLARPPAAGVPQVDELEDLADPPPAACAKDPEQATRRSRRSRAAVRSG